MWILNNIIVCPRALIPNEIGFLVSANELIAFLNMAFGGKWSMALKLPLLLDYFGKPEILLIVKINFGR